MTTEFAKRRDDPLGFLLHERVCQTFFRTHKKMTDKLPIQEELSFKFPASWKFLLETIYLWAEDQCPNGTEEL